MTKPKKTSALQTQQSVAEYIIAHPGSTAAEIALGLGRVKSTVRFAVRHLVDAGIVSVHQPEIGPHRHYAASNAPLVQSRFGVNRLVNLFDRCVMSVRRECAA